MRVAIIGGGASGISAAISIKKNHKNVDVTILERFDRIGKKLLATGNGKCNIGNINLDSSYYNNPDFVEKVIKRMPLKSYMDYLEELGIYLKKDSEGRIYPFSDSTKTVLDILIRNLEQLKVDIVTNFNVSNITREKKGFIVYNQEGDSLYFDKVILCYGSKSQTKDVTITKTLEKLNHSITRMHPVLVPLKLKENVKDVSGLRFKAKIDLYVDGNFTYSESGEILFKDDGIGGIVILNVSRYIKKGKKNILKINLINDLDYDLDKYLNTNKDLSVLELLEGIVHKKMALKLSKQISKATEIKEILQNLKFEVTDTYGYEFSQVTSGGISVNEINDMFESIKIPNLYILGEALDVDGACGGYNLYFAFATGAILGKNIFTN